MKDSRVASLMVGAAAGTVAWLVISNLGTFLMLIVLGSMGNYVLKKVTGI